MATLLTSIPDSTVIEDNAPTNLGDHIRQLRNDRRWSLNELSTRSKIAASTLSKVENGTLSLTYDRLLQVAQGFGLTLSEFLAPPATDTTMPAGAARLSWARKGSGEQVETAGYIYNYLCTSLRAKRMVPIVSLVKARNLGEFGELLRHDGEEFAFVLKGRIEVVTEFYAAQVLEEGEGVYIDSRQGHAYLNAGEGEAWIVSVNCDTIVE
jgi:transcriptional regulator with XRE-family HTH domain